MTKTGFLLGGVLLALSAAALGGKFYKWVDENGVTHYDTRPPEGRQTEQVRTYNSASSSQPAALERLKKQRKKAAEKRKKAERQAREAKRLNEEPDQVVKERCKQYRKNLKILTNKPTVRMKNPDTGKMEVIDQARREKLLKDTRDALATCRQQNVKPAP